MATLRTSPGSTAEPARPPAATPSRVRRLPPAALLSVLLVAAALGAPAVPAQQPKLLEAERAFAFSARALDAATVEARFAVADGYYLYRDKLKFSAMPGSLARASDLPAGVVKRDEFFGEVATYRGEVVVRLPLAAAAPGTTVTVVAESQGCADAGVCYPPQIQKIALALPATGAGPGPVVEASPARKGWFK